MLPRKGARCPGEQQGGASLVKGVGHLGGLPRGGEGVSQAKKA